MKAREKSLAFLRLEKLACPTNSLSMWYNRHMINERFNRLTVLSEAPDSTSKHRKWSCICDCGGTKNARQDHLKKGLVGSCGCLQKERTRLAVRKPNRFEIKDDHVVVYANNTGSEFYVDLDDWPKVSEHGWYENDKGYLCSRVDGKIARLHRLIMCPEDGILVDHKDMSPANNRRSNLRLCTNSQNLMNKSESSNNKSGMRGVFWVDRHRKWVARIQQKHIGYFAKFEDAVTARKKAEKELFGEFAPETGS